MPQTSSAELLAQLRELLDEPGVLTEPSDMAGYLSDWRGAYSGEALAVARPTTTNEVAEVVRACAAANVAVVAQGGNTGLCGGAVPSDVPAVELNNIAGQVVLSLTRMRKVRAVDPVENTITVDAGVTLREVQEAAAEVGRLFPLSLGSEGSCTIGGNLSTNAGGATVLRYGMMRQLALGLEVVLPDGRIWDGLRPLRKDNTGYDLKQLFIGAEGTLGIITSAVLSLFPATPTTATAWVGLRDLTAGPAVLNLARTQAGDVLTAAELMSNQALSMVLKHVPGASSPLSEPVDWAVLLEVTGQQGAPVDETLQAVVEAAAEDELITDAVFAVGTAPRAKLWMLRESISEAQNLEGPSLKHDITVPISRLVDFASAASARLNEICPGIRLVTFGHVGDGNLHYNLSKPEGSDDAAFMAQATELTDAVYESVNFHGGSISAEHGIGASKRGALVKSKDKVELDIMRIVKVALDPHGFMNPGTVL